MIIAGLTGSIAMGKSTVSGMFAELGVPTFDADEAVRHFYAGEGASVVEAAFPGVVVLGQVSRFMARIASSVERSMFELKADVVVSSSAFCTD